MTELLVEMAFACCRCEGNSYFTVHCAGAGLDAGPRITLNAAVPCYACGARHDVWFHPTGEVVCVQPRHEPLLQPIPSRN